MAGPLAGHQAEAFASRLADENADLKTKLAVATELRDSIDAYQNNSDYENFLAKVVPEILKLLDSVPISFSSSATEQRLRNCLLDMLLRLQTNDTLKPYAVDILATVMKLLQADNEDNGVLCMKILTNLHRAYKVLLLDQVQPYLDLVIQMYKNIPQVVTDMFGAQGASTSAPSAGTPPVTSFQSPKPLSPSTSSDLAIETASRPLQKSTHSFKVLTECPIIIVLLYSAHKQLVNESLPVFIPRIIEMLTIQAAPQAKEHAEAAKRGEVYTSISPLIKNRAAYGEFIVAQVKTMSFLAYAMRGFSPSLKQYHSVIPDVVVRLLQDCPCELSGARKELLVATRHILTTEFRTLFIPKVDVLLNEDVLLGKGLTTHETLRPLAYSSIADLIHHIRAELTSEQIWKTVKVYSKNMQDDSLQTNFQIMSAKLLLNLGERIMKLPDRHEGRQLMVLILNAFVERFSSLNRSSPRILRIEKEKREQQEKEKEEKEKEEKEKEEAEKQRKREQTGDSVKIEEVEKEEESIKPEEMEVDEPQDKSEDILAGLELMDVLDPGVISVHGETASSELKDARYVFKNLMNFLKTVMFGLKSCNPPPPHTDISPAQWQESARMFNYEQITIFRRLFREGVKGLRLFANPKLLEDFLSQVASNVSGVDLPGSTMPAVSSKDEKDLMEAFSAVFVHIDQASFNEIIEAELPFLYEQMFENPALLWIPHLFVTTEAMTANFAGILLAFLKTKLPVLGNGDPVKSHVIIRLFKFCFLAVNLFPNVNEAVLLPHLRVLIIKSMELSTTATEPLMYFHLLRALFRSIGGGRYELLYKEVLPLLQVLLESLNKLISTARKPHERDIYVELCLTVPVRLSVLVPHLSYLMRPLVLALNGSQELVSQGLRTLELCVDNLTATYFDPIIEPVVDEVMEALWKHLRPLPYYHQHSHTTLRVLGKLGGRNRAFLKPPANLLSTSLLEQDINVVIGFHGIPGKSPLSITPGVKAALNVLEDPRAQAHYRVKAYEYISCVLKLFIDTDGIDEDELDSEAGTKELATKIQKTVSTAARAPAPKLNLPEAANKDFKRRKLQTDLVEKLLDAVFYATSIPQLEKQANEFIRNICEHNTILELADFIVVKRRALLHFDIDESEGIPTIDPRTLLSVIVTALSHYHPTVRSAGQEAIHHIYKTGEVLLGSQAELHNYPMFRSLFGKLTHTCFEEEYFRKSGACLGLKTVIEDLKMPTEGIAKRQVEFVRTMFFVLKDIPQDVPSSVRNDASELLYYVLKQCNQNLTDQQMDDRPFKQLSGLLAYELGNANVSVRATSKEALKILSEVTGRSITQLLRQVTSVFLGPIFGKPLRALPFPMQIGYIDAIAFCLELPEQLLEFNDELTRLLVEALALVEAEDESLTSAHRVFEYLTAEQLVQLRIVCIQLLSLALTTSDYLSTQQAQTRTKIIAVFFKTLYSRSSKVVDAAHKGLKKVLAHNSKIPKDLLQNGLKPILMNLSDHKRITVAGLEGLARLLELLTYYFKVEIGKKLLDHLDAWSKTPHLQSISVKNLASQQSVQIIVAILNVFHLLPPTAHIFMDDLMKRLFYLETNLRRQQSSPFRIPIAKYLNRYPKEALEYFLPRLTEATDGRFFASILANGGGSTPEDRKLTKELRKHTRENIDALRNQILGNESPEAKCSGICNLIYVLRALAVEEELEEGEENQNWLLSQVSILEDINSSVSDMVNTAAVGSPMSPLLLQVDQALTELQSLTVSYVEEATSASDEVPVTAHDMVFSLIGILCSSNVNVSGDLIEFLFSHVVKSESVELRRLYLQKSIELASNKAVCISARRFVIRYFVNPTLVVEGKRNGELSGLLEKCTGTAKGNAWLDVVHARIWRPSAPDTGDDVGTIDLFKFELLQMSALLIKLAPGLVADARKDIIKFGWNYIKLEDIISKQAAYVLIAHFIAAYDTLSKIVVQIFMALLKTHQSDAKSLVKQALDLLAPVLVKRVNSPLWAKLPRRVLIEDGHNISQVINIYQFIGRHPDLFFEYRDHFIPNIISAMPKLSFFPSASPENQTLAVDLAELILKWENMALEKGASTEEAPEGDMETISQPYSVPLSQREACVTYLIRFLCVSNQKVSESVLGQRIVRILDELLSAKHWPDVTVKLSYLERSLVQNELTSPDAVAVGLNALEVIRLTLSHKDSAWIVSNLSHLERLLERSIHSESFEIHTSLEGLLDIILTAINAETDEEEGQPEEVQAFTSLLTNAVSEHLSANHTAPGILMACSLVKYKASVVDSFLPSLMKALSRLCKEHTSEGTDAATAVSGGTTVAAPANGAPNSTSANGAVVTTPGSAGTVPPTSAAPTELSSKETILLLGKVIALASLRISYLGDQRRVFLSLIAQLIEKSKDQSICLQIVEITRNWVFSRTDLFPTTKEKAAILVKMMSFEARGDVDLTNEFYSIVVNIYDDPALSRSELSVRMEHAFLVGTRLSDVPIRSRLMKILSSSIENDVLKRLQYIISDQNWEYIGDSQWLNQALQVLYGGIRGDIPLRLSADEFKFASLQSLDLLTSQVKVKEEENVPEETKEAVDVDEDTKEDMDVDMGDDEADSVPAVKETEMGEPSEALLKLAARRREFLRAVNESVTIVNLINPLVELQYHSADLVHAMWVQLFKVVYAGVPRKDRTEMMRGLITLLAKDYHNRQVDSRPNVIQTLLEGVGTCEQLPPQLVKYMGVSFNAWHSAIQILENIEQNPQTDSAKVADANLDALAELYSGLQDDDMFYGLWRRRAKYTETNSGLSYEQCGMLTRAMQMYEAAQIRARSGVLPYGESEYGLWEDHWIMCSQKLQQWDILTELAKHEGFTDLLLECGWRVADWTADKEPLEQSIKTVMDVPTPRRQIFETFLCLQGYAQKSETIQDLSRYCDEGIQLALRKWYGMPKHITGAHIPLLHTFQQYVEFMEASQVYSSLASTTAQNLETKSQELKGVLQAWRERLPNLWDDINIWGDLVTWRQHAFGVVNKVYLPLIQNQNGGNNAAGAGAGANNNSANSYAYRGFHEIAWIINRFAHVARKHNMPEVCISQLGKIYQLPNIEIQEAFLKLREQAKCYYQNPNEMNTGLDVISNTNLVYFGAQQKAEFFTLKGMFQAKLNNKEEANQAFATAVQIDLYLPKAWAEWGYFHDRRFRENPSDLKNAGNAISCYLQAAGLYKNAKTRKLLGRILWLISLDDGNGAISNAFDTYRGEVPVWYWITYIPQLLTSLSHKEARLARHVLIKISKSYPQALHFHLRTTREDYAVLQRQAQQAASAGRGASGVAANSGGTAAVGSPVPGADPKPANGAAAANGAAGAAGANGSDAARQPWEYVEEIMNILKTAYPLLCLSLETIVDQLYHRFKCQADEDAYRLIVALLNDGVQYMGRLQYPKEDAKLPPATETNITRFAESVLPKHIKPSFEKDFVQGKPNLEAYVVKLRKWRDRFESKLDGRQGKVNLESLSPPLSEFHYQKFEDVEVPGQYFEHKDNNMHFVKIDRFLSTVDIVRGFGVCYRRLTIRGHDGSLHPFAVQYPSARHSRREERVAQLFKILNGVISRRKETRRRNLQFTLPVAVPLTPHIRIVQDDPRYISMNTIYENYCKQKGQSRDAPLDLATQKLRAAFDPKLPKPDVAAAKLEILTAVQATLVPTTILRDYFAGTYASYEDFWLFRKQFSYQYAGLTFMAFLMSINSRYPHKFLINLASGNVWATEMLPILPPSKNAPSFHNGEPVPFRLTPNIQTLMGPTAMEGLYAMAIVIIARGLTEPEFDLDQYLCVFVRDELISWYTQQHRPSVQDQQLREIVRVNVEAIVKRASSLAQIGQGNIPVNQTVIDLISQAVNPRHLALTDNLWMPYL